MIDLPGVGFLSQLFLCSFNLFFFTFSQFCLLGQHSLIASYGPLKDSASKLLWWGQDSSDRESIWTFSRPFRRLGNCPTKTLLKIVDVLEEVFLNLLIRIMIWDADLTNPMIADHISKRRLYYKTGRARRHVLHYKQRKSKSYSQRSHVSERKRRGNGLQCSRKVYQITDSRTVLRWAGSSRRWRAHR